MCACCFYLVSIFEAKVVGLLNQCSINHSPCAMPMDATANNNNEQEEFL